MAKIYKNERGEDVTMAIYVEIAKSASFNARMAREHDYLHPNAKIEFQLISAKQYRTLMDIRGCFDA